MAKIFCYAILVVAFLLFFQKDPFFALIILGVIFSLFLLVRKRKHSSGNAITSFLSGKEHVQTSQLNNVVMVLALDKLLNTSKEDDLTKNKKKSLERKKQIENMKQEIMELLERE